MILAQIGGAGLGVGADLVGRAARDDGARDEDRDPVGKAEDGLHVVLNEEHRVGGFERLQRLGQRLALGPAHPRHGLVEEKRPGAARDGDGKLEKALFAVGERARRDARARAKADPGEGLHGGLVERGLFGGAPEETEAGARARLGGEGHVFEGTVNSGMIEVIWNERPSPAMARSARLRPVTSRPSKAMRPASGARTPEI